MSATADFQAIKGLPERYATMDPELFRRRFGRGWQLQVVEAFDLTPRMRRVVYTADDLDEMRALPGQEIVMLIPGDSGELERRHYTIRGVDRAAKRLIVDFVLHGDSPAGRHARDAQAGDGMLILGPRGRQVLYQGADWRLFVGDETALPAIFGMVEALPAGDRADVFMEIGGEDDKQPLQSAGQVNLVWLPRGGVPAGRSQVLAEAMAAYELPAGVGHAYTLGETSAIRAVRHSLVAKGQPKGLIFSYGYWRPGRIGGHDHVDD